MHRIGIDAGIFNQGLVIDVQGPFAGGQRHIRKCNVDAAVSNYRAVGRGRLVPVAVNQARRRRDLDNGRTVQFGHIEIADG